MTPTLLDELVANQAFWGDLLFAAFAGLVWATIEILKAWHAESAKLDRVLKYGPPEDLTFCDTHGHDVATDAAGWHCVNCGQVTRQPLNCGGAHRYEARGQSLECSVCGMRAALPYNQMGGVA